jgi:hypothetical protein
MGLNFSLICEAQHVKYLIEIRDELTETRFELKKSTLIQC